MWNVPCYSLVAISTFSYSKFSYSFWWSQKINPIVCRIESNFSLNICILFFPFAIENLDIPEKLHLFLISNKFNYKIALDSGKS